MRFPVSRMITPTTRGRSVDAGTGPSRPASVKAEVSHRQAISPEPAAMAAASHLLATAAAKVEAAASRVASVSKPRGAAPHVSASAADAIFVERMRAATTLEAFRTVVRISSPDQPIEFSATRLQDRTAEPSVAGDGAADLGWRTPRASMAVDRVSDAARLVGSARPADPQTDMPPRFSPRLDEVRDAAREVLDRGGQQPAAAGGRPSWLTGDAGLTGLRRLAALATESLGDPSAGEPAVRPVAASEAALPLDEELERILRSEALSHGIDLDGRAR